MPTSRAARLLLLAVACIGLLACGFVWYAARDSHADVVAESSSAGGWKTIEYHGVRVDIPASWEPTDPDECEFQFEHWVPPGSPDCGFDGGVAFYVSATFDPAHGPGVRPADRDADPDWGGYAEAGDWAVWVSDDDQALVEKVLDSVE